MAAPSLLVTGCGLPVRTRASVASPTDNPPLSKRMKRCVSLPPGNRTQQGGMRRETALLYPPLADRSPPPVRAAPPHPSPGMFVAFFSLLSRPRLAVALGALLTASGLLPPHLDAEGPYRPRPTSHPRSGHASAGSVSAGSPHRLHKRGSAGPHLESKGTSATLHRRGQGAHATHHFDMSMLRDVTWALHPPGTPDSGVFSHASYGSSHEYGPG